ncbi:MAG: cytochrome c maturation protein CcmE [Deltaproteobacteria bacterium]|nr:cytochrome c maturation protein CcmE [Deltaproteobacteria bacterium]
MQKKLVLILGIVIIAGALGYLAFGKLENNIVYFVTPSELLAKGEVAFGKPVRLGGMVKKGTIEWDAQNTLLQFQMNDGTKEIAIISHETPPQMFQDEMGVVVEGKLSPDGIFRADRLMVRHSNEYRPPKEGEKPAVIYKDLVDTN